MEIYWTEIQKVIEETPEVRTYHLACPKDVTWEEGAHIHLALEGFNAGDKPNRSLVRHMSISTTMAEKTIGITTRIKEECSEFKSILRQLPLGEKVALFKINSNLALRKENRPIYLLSSGVGLASFRPLTLQYFADQTGVPAMHSLNVSVPGEDTLFADVFKTQREKHFQSEFVNSRQAYYQAVNVLAKDQTGLFYLVGSDKFLQENIQFLQERGIALEQIVIDKHPNRRTIFLEEMMSESIKK